MMVLYKIYIYHLIWLVLWWFFRTTFLHRRCTRSVGGVSGHRPMASLWHKWSESSAPILVRSFFVTTGHGIRGSGRQHGQWTSVRPQSRWGKAGKSWEKLGNYRKLIGSICSKTTNLYKFIYCTFDECRNCIWELQPHRNDDEWWVWRHLWARHVFVPCFSGWARAHTHTHAHTFQWFTLDCAEVGPKQFDRNLAFKHIYKLNKSGSGNILFRCKKNPGHKMLHWFLLRLTCSWTWEWQVEHNCSWQVCGADHTFAILAVILPATGSMQSETEQSCDVSSDELEISLGSSLHLFCIIP